MHGFWFNLFGLLLRLFCVVRIKLVSLASLTTIKWMNNCFQMNELSFFFAKQKHLWPWQSHTEGPFFHENMYKLGNWDQCYSNAMDLNHYYIQILSWKKIQLIHKLIIRRNILSGSHQLSISPLNRSVLMQIFRLNF